MSLLKLVFGDEVKKVLPTHAFQNKIEILGILKELYEFDYVGVVTDSF